MSLDLDHMRHLLQIGRADEINADEIEELLDIIAGLRRKLYENQVAYSELLLQVNTEPGEKK